MTPSHKILSGHEIAKRYLDSAKKEIEALKVKNLTLATVRVGQSKDSELYAQYLKNLLEKTGIRLIAKDFPEHVAEKKLFDEIRKLNRDRKVTGIMVFAPLPKHIDPIKVFDHIAMLKDAEGRTFLKSHLGVFSPTAHAIITLLESTGCDFAGKEAIVVGHSDLVGKPTAVLLMDLLATVTVCHIRTRDLREHIQRADIVVAAAGKAHLIKGEWIKPGAIVIDVGENVLDGRIVGDVEFETAKENASFISPVPGGVGPVTNVMLIKNLLTLYKLQKERRGTL